MKARRTDVYEATSDFESYSLDVYSCGSLTDDSSKSESESYAYEFDSMSDESSDASHTSSSSSSQQPLAQESVLRSSVESAYSTVEHMGLSNVGRRQRRESLQSSAERAKKGNWNERFQRIVGTLVTNEEERWEKARQLNDLFELFENTVAPIARAIIEDEHLIDELKRYTPLAGAGVAGGTKFVLDDQGIFVKYASVDEHGIYGSPLAAAKSVNHELKTLNTLVEECQGQLDSIHVPLCVGVTHLGRTLMFLSVLPIDDDTLVYGSNDGADTVHNSSSEFASLARRLADMLNLAPHRVGLHKGRTSELVFAGDVEGHRGADGAFYLLDFARFFPPQPPMVPFGEAGAKPDRRTIFSQLLRPDVVRTSPHALNADVFSSFTRHDPKRRQHQRDVCMVFSNLIGRVLPDFFGESELFAEWSPQRLVDGMHARGLNVRLLPFARQQQRRQGNGAAHPLLLVELVARVVKCRARERLLALTTDSVLAMRALVAKYIGRYVLGGGAEPSRHFWCVRLKAWARRYFRTLCTPFCADEMADDFDLRHSLGADDDERARWVDAVAQRASDLIGARWENADGSEAEPCADAQRVFLVPKTKRMKIRPRQLDERALLHLDESLRSQIAIRQEQFGSHHPSVAACVERLAEVLLHLQRYGEASDCYMQALEIREACCVVLVDRSLATSSSSSISDSDSDSTDASAAASSSSNELTMSAGNATSRLLEAPGSANYVVQVSEHRMLDLCTLLRRLAVLYHMRGEFERSELYAYRALATRQCLQGEHRVACADDLHILGWISKASQKFAEAQCYLRRSIELKRSIDEHPRLSDSLVELARVKMALGQSHLRDQVIELQEEALENAAQYWDPMHSRFGVIHNNRSIAFAWGGDFKRALEAGCKALEVRVASLGRRNHLVGHTLSLIALIILFELPPYRIDDDYSDSIDDDEEEEEEEEEEEALTKIARLLDESQSIYESAGNQYLVGNALSNRSLLHMYLLEYEQALEVSNRAVSCFLESLGPSHVLYNITRLENAAIQLDLFQSNRDVHAKRYPAALALLQETFEALKGASPSILAKSITLLRSAAFVTNPTKRISFYIMIRRIRVSVLTLFL
jgi:tetratricopeptide (TPR) repeat protein